MIKVFIQNGIGISSGKHIISPALLHRRSSVVFDVCKKPFGLVLCSWRTKSQLTKIVLPQPDKIPGQLIIPRSNSLFIRSYSSNSAGVSDPATPIENTDMPDYIVGHDESKKCFYIKLQNQSSTQQEALALLEYRWIRPGLVDLYHTEVPPEFQGQGIAKHLAKAAFDFFCDQDTLIRPTCTYLQKYLRDNPVPRYMDCVEADRL